MRLYQNHFFTSQAFGIWTVCTVDDIRKTASTLFYNFFFFAWREEEERGELAVAPYVGRAQVRGLLRAEPDIHHPHDDHIHPAQRQHRPT